MTLEEAAEMLGRLRQEMLDQHELLTSIADDVLAVEAEASIERAKQIPISQSAAERRARGRGRGHARAQRESVEVRPGYTRSVVAGYGWQRTKRGAYRPRRKRRRKLNYDYLPTPKAIDREAGMEAALTAEMDDRLPTALREIQGDTLFWGTQRWIPWASYHLKLTTQPEGRTKWMPSRIDFGVGASATVLEEGLLATGEEWLYLRLEKAGAPPDWLAEALPRAA